MSRPGNLENLAVYSLTLLIVAIPLQGLLAPDLTDEATLGPDMIDMPSEPIYLAIGVLMVVAVSLRIAAFPNGSAQSTAEIDSAR